MSYLHLSGKMSEQRLIHLERPPSTSPNRRKHRKNMKKHLAANATRSPPLSPTTNRHDAPPTRISYDRPPTWPPSHRPQKLCGGFSGSMVIRALDLSERRARTQRAHRCGAVGWVGQGDVRQGGGGPTFKGSLSFVKMRQEKGT